MIKTKEFLFYIFIFFHQGNQFNLLIFGCQKQNGTFFALSGE